MLSHALTSARCLAMLILAGVASVTPVHTQFDKVSAALSDLSSPDASIRQQAARKLGNLGAWEAAEPLVVALADENKDVRDEVRSALEALGEDAADALIEGLGSDTAAVRGGCLNVMGRLAYVEDERFGSAIPPLVKDPDVQVRIEACAALGQLGEMDALGALKEALGDGDQMVRTVAAVALARLGDASGFEQLLRGAASSDVRMRALVIEPLSLIGNPPAVQALRDLVGDADREIRAGAYAGLFNVGTPEAVATGLEGLKDPAWQVRSHIAHTIGVLQVPGSADALLDRLADDESASVKVASAMALARLGDQRAIAPLLEMLGHPSDMQRAGAASALGVLHSDEAVKPLTDLLEDESPQVRRAARLALIQILEDCPDCPK